MFGLGSILSGAQTTMHDWRMARQLLRTLLFWVMLTVLATLAWSVHGLWRDHPQQVKAAWLHARAMTIGELQPDDTPYGFTRADGRAGTVTVGEITGNPAFAAAWRAQTGRLIGAAASGAGGAGGMVLALIVVFRLRGARMHRTTWKRGTRTAPAARLDALTRRTWRWLPWLPSWLPAWTGGPMRRGQPFALAGVTWPRGGETRHTLIVGTTGSGKTVAMSALLDQIRAGGGKAVVYDKLGSYIPHFYRHGRDVILNPLDARSRDWDLFAEARHEQDFSMIADALIPAFKDTADPFWTTAARQLFASGAAALWKADRRSIPELVELLLRTDLGEMAKRMEGMVEQSIIDPANPKTALSVRAVLGTAVKPLTWMPEPRDPLSIRQWVESASDSVLFLSSDAPSHPSRRAMIATQIEIALIATLSSRRRAGGRMWFVIDELPTLERIPSLTSGLRESRQFGGAFVIGTQVVSELREIYGRNEAETISGNCNTRLILSSPDMATAEWCANALGRSMAERTLEGRSFGSSEVRDGVNIQRREEIRNAVLPSEIMELPSLEGWLRMGAGLPVAKVRLVTRDRPVIAPHLVPAARIDRLTGEVYEADGPADNTAGTPTDPHGRDPDMGVPEYPEPDAGYGDETPSLPGLSGPDTGTGDDIPPLHDHPVYGAPDGSNTGEPDRRAPDAGEPNRSAPHRQDGINPGVMAQVAARLGVRGDVAGDGLPSGLAADANRSGGAAQGDAGIGDAGMADHWRGAPTPSGPPPETPAAAGPEPCDGGWPEGEGPAGPVPDWMAQVPPAAHDGRKTETSRTKGKDALQPGFFDGIDGNINDAGAADVKDAGDRRNMPGTDAATPANASDVDTGHVARNETDAVAPETADRKDETGTDGITPPAGHAQGSGIKAGDGNQASAIPVNRSDRDAADDDGDRSDAGVRLDDGASDRSPEDMQFRRPGRRAAHRKPANGSTGNSGRKLGDW